MPVQTVAASTPFDLGSLLTNLGVLILAIAATVSGVFTGWRQFKKTLDPEKPQPTGTEQYRILSASIMETNSMKALTESNHEMIEQMRRLCVRLEDVSELIRDNSKSTSSLNEESHRLRVAVQDAHELARRFKL